MCKYLVGDLCNRGWNVFKELEEVLDTLGGDVEFRRNVCHYAWRVGTL